MSDTASSKYHRGRPVIKPPFRVVRVDQFQGHCEDGYGNERKYYNLDEAIKAARRITGESIRRCKARKDWQGMADAGMVYDAQGWLVWDGVREYMKKLRDPVRKKESNDVPCEEIRAICERCEKMILAKYRGRRVPRGIIADDEDPSQWYSDWYNNVGDGDLSCDSPEALYLFKECCYLEMRKKGCSLAQILEDLDIPAPKKTIPKWEAQCTEGGVIKRWVEALRQKYILIGSGGVKKAEINGYRKYASAMTFYLPSGEQAGDLVVYGKGREFMFSSRKKLIKLKLRDRDEGSEFIHIGTSRRIHIPFKSSECMEIIHIDHRKRKPKYYSYFESDGNLRQVQDQSVLYFKDMDSLHAYYSKPRLPEPSRRRISPGEDGMIWITLPRSSRNHSISFRDEGMNFKAALTESGGIKAIGISRREGRMHTVVYARDRQKRLATGWDHGKAFIDLWLPR